MGLGTRFEGVEERTAPEAREGGRPRIGLRKEPRIRGSASPREAPHADEDRRSPTHLRVPEADVSDATILLCAAAYLRDDHVGTVARACSRYGPVAPRVLWILLTRRGAERKAALQKVAKKLKRDDGQPKILFGHAYNSWVRRRIARGQAVPPHGFHLTRVLQTSAAAEGLTHLRRVVLLVAMAGAAVIAARQHFTAAFFVAIGGAWLACYADRLCARTVLRREPWATGGLARFTSLWVSPKRRRLLHEQARDGLVVPYVLNLRKYRSPAHSIVGAGNLWSEHAIGIDVAPAVSEEAQRTESREERLVRQAFRSVQDIVGDGREGFDQFTPDQLHEHVADELEKLRDGRSQYQPVNRLDVFDVAAVSGESWNDIDADEWAALLTLAQQGAEASGAAGDTKRARRMLCTRIVSWDGELVAALYIGFAYEHHFLRITVRPHVVNPVNTRLTKAMRAARRTGVRRGLREALNAFLDLFAFLGRLRKPFTRPRPELDDADPVSLREAYSCRHMDDMLQYDDARRYVSWMERCVFRAVLGFLRSRNVDVSAFLNQATYILQNSGVVNAGTMGDVQNQPGSHNSTATMNSTPSPEGGNR